LDHASLSFQWERFPAIAKELSPLFVRHGKEILVDDPFPLEPDWDRFCQLDVAGILRVLAARDESKRLVGYVGNFVLPSLMHASVLFAIVEGVWLDPLYRQGMNGYKLLRHNDAGLREMGCKAITFQVSSHFAEDRGTLGLLLKRLGYALHGHVYFKLLE
jgi:hypothetical protein